MKVILKKNLRRQILRGHPWVYHEALSGELVSHQTAQLCQVYDNKGFLAWALYDPHGPLALRILSLEKKTPNKFIYQQAFERASALRNLVIDPTTTNCYRLFNGEGDFLPGLVCDIYNETAVIQLDGQGPSEFWDIDFIVQWLKENTNCRLIIEKSRTKPDRQIHVLYGDLKSGPFLVKENKAHFFVDIEKGQKTGFFLDQRDNRQYLKSICKEKTVLNMFSYTGGFSIYAGLGKAQEVTSLDISPKAIDLAQKNWELNQLPKEKHKAICDDVFEYIKNTKDKWDFVLVDPPSMSHSEKQKPAAIQKYTDLFAASSLLVKKGGHIFLSSCSSHISFNDFFEIINQALSQSRRRGQILKVSGQGADHPFPHICHELRYLKLVHIVLD